VQTMQEGRHSVYVLQPPTQSETPEKGKGKGKLKPKTTMESGEPSYEAAVRTLESYFSEGDIADLDDDNDEFEINQTPIPERPTVMTDTQGHQGKVVKFTPHSPTQLSSITTTASIATFVRRQYSDSSATSRRK
jgi:hypothetical protein